MRLDESLDVRSGARPKKKKRAAFLEPLIRAARTYLRDLFREFVRDSLEEAIDWTLARLLSYLFAGALGVIAVVFLLLGAVEGMKALSIPPYCAYTAASMAALIAGLICLRSTRLKREP